MLMADTESELHKELARLKKINRDLGALRLGSLMSEHQDRLRLLDILHSGIIQLLIGAQLKITQIDSEHNTATEVSALKDLIDSAIETAHLLADEIAPHVLFKIGLEAALYDLLKKYEKDHGISYYIDMQLNDAEFYDETINLILYNIIKRLINSIVVSHEATVVGIRIQLKQTYIDTTIEDNGNGFNIQGSATADADKGIEFLMSAAEEVRLLSGNVWLEIFPLMRKICISIPREKTKIHNNMNN